MNTIVISDLHIGSRFFSCSFFEGFLGQIPKSAEIVLNGDIIENHYEKLKPPHRNVLDLIGRISCHQPVVWICGNHDNGYIPHRLGNITFKNRYAVSPGTMVAHGDYFDGIMPRTQTFIRTFNLMHHLRIRLGARPVHVAEYAKKWKPLYRVLRRNIMVNAVNYAKANGYDTIVCGHTHYAEDTVYNGVRYINTGA